MWFNVLTWISGATAVVFALVGLIRAVNALLNAMTDCAETAGGLVTALRKLSKKLHSRRRSTVQLEKSLAPPETPKDDLIVLDSVRKKPLPVSKEEERRP